MSAAQGSRPQPGERWQFRHVSTGPVLVLAVVTDRGGRGHVVFEYAGDAGVAVLPAADFTGRYVGPVAADGRVG